MKQNDLSSVKCIYCDIMLVGRDQFIGHMIHGHELGYEQVKRLWSSIGAAHDATHREHSGFLVVSKNKVLR